MILEGLNKLWIYVNIMEKHLNKKPDIILLRDYILFEDKEKIFDNLRL